jgi:glycyl-tRNA synthetase beta chain
VVQRAARLAVKGDLPTGMFSPGEVVDPGLFSSPSEKGMLQVLMELVPILAVDDGETRYRLLANKLAEGSEALSAFFDGASSVMVMCDDLAVRRNRLNMLAVLRNQASALADFSKLSS